MQVHHIGALVVQDAREGRGGIRVALAIQFARAVHVGVDGEAPYREAVVPVGRVLARRSRHHHGIAAPLLFARQAVDVDLRAPYGIGVETEWNMQQFHCSCSARFTCR